MLNFKKIILLIIGIELSACGSTDNYCSASNIEQLFQKYLSEQVALLIAKHAKVKDVNTLAILTAQAKEVLALVDIDLEDIRILNSDDSKRMGQCAAKLTISVPPPLLDIVNDSRVHLKQGLFSQYAKELGIENKENTFTQQINYVVNSQVNPKYSQVNYDSAAWEHLFLQILKVYSHQPIINNLKPVSKSPPQLISTSSPDIIQTTDQTPQTPESVEIQTNKADNQPKIWPEVIADNSLDKLAQSSHPSFDCNKATTPTDITICATSELADLDVSNMGVYKQAKLINQNLTKSIWRESIKYKYACGTEVDCIQQIYHKTISLYGCVIKNASCQNDIVF